MWHYVARILDILVQLLILQLPISRCAHIVVIGLGGLLPDRCHVLILMHEHLYAFHIVAILLVQDLVKLPHFHLLLLHAIVFIFVCLILTLF